MNSLSHSANARIRTIQNMSLQRMYLTLTIEFLPCFVIQTHYAVIDSPATDMTSNRISNIEFMQ